MTTSNGKTDVGENKDSIQLEASQFRQEEVESDLVLDSAVERKLVRKIDLHLMPLMFILYLFQYLDKTSLGYTAIMGIIEDTHLVGSQYSWVSSFFYVGFLIASPITSVALVRFSVVRVVAVTVLIWAGIQMAMAAGNNFGSLAALRILLGAFEAAVNPGFTIVTSTWYKPSEHALRHGIWYGGASVAYIFGGLLAYAISHISSAIKSWQFLFLIFGAATFLWGLVVLLLLPMSPKTAWFLTPNERKLAFARVQGLRHSAETRKWKVEQMKEALIDARSWLLFLLCIFTTLPGGGLTAFGSIILQSFGYNMLQTQLLTMSQGAFLLFFVIFSVGLSMIWKDGRCISVALLNVVSLAGTLMIMLLPMSNKLGRLGGLWLIGGHASAFPTILSLVSSNVTGHTKKSTVNGMLFFGFCIGYIIGPLTFLPQEAPDYKTAFNIMIACFVLNIAIVLAMRQLMARWNKKRDQEFGMDPDRTNAMAVGEEALVERDETDWDNKHIRYSL